MDFKNGIATFIIPHFSTGSDYHQTFFDECLTGIFDQTDSNWHIIVVDDDSPSEAAKDYLKHLEQIYPDKITSIFNKDNKGPGFCRNIGIARAYESKSPFLLFNDSDDISNKKRLEVTRNAFLQDPDAGVVYSTFRIIDEAGQFVANERITASIMEILDSHKMHGPQGHNLWVDIGIKYGYVNLTSATSVKTEIASKNPFPHYKVAEDAHTWLRYSAYGAKFVYLPDIPSLYRIPQNAAGSSSRSREGKSVFYRKAKDILCEGFNEALNLALRNNGIQKDDNLIEELWIRFYLKLGETFNRENEVSLTGELIEQARGLSEPKTRKLMPFYKVDIE
jgi:glycosyltransferase involved in cell wall biosynthesis